MRIGVVTDNYFPSVGGTEISISNYLKELQKAGHTVIVFCPRLKVTDKSSNSPDNIVRLPSIHRIYPDHPLMFIYPGITKKFRSYNLDIIHSHTPISAPYVAEYVSQQLKLPHVHTLHTLVPEQVKRWRVGFWRTMNLYLVQSLLIGNFKRPNDYLLQDEKRTLALKVRLSWIYILRVLNLPTTVIVPGRHVQDILVARGYKHRVYVLPTFSSIKFSGKHKIQLTDSRKKTIEIIYVGRLDIEKRPQILIDVARLLPKDLNWHLKIIGTGSQLRKLKHLVKSYGLQSYVEFTGRLSQRAIAKEYEKADIFVLPSYRFDTQAIVLLEASSAGLPIVYCDNNLTIGVERKNSILTKPFAQSIAQGVITLIKNDNLRYKLSLGSLEVSKKYTAQKLVKRLLWIYNKSLKDYSNKHTVNNN